MPDYTVFLHADAPELLGRRVPLDRLTESRRVCQGGVSVGCVGFAVGVRFLIPNCNLVCCCPIIAMLVDIDWL